MNEYVHAYRNPHFEHRYRTLHNPGPFQRWPHHITLWIKPRNPRLTYGCQILCWPNKERISVLAKNVEKSCNTTGSVCGRTLTITCVVFALLTETRFVRSLHCARLTLQDAFRTHRSHVFERVCTSDKGHHQRIVPFIYHNLVSPKVSFATGHTVGTTNNVLPE